MATVTQWKILQCLGQKNKKSTRDIQACLQNSGIEITLRSVQRNLDVLQGVFPIESDNNNPAGWRWRGDARPFNLPVMEPETAVTLRMVEMHLEPLLPQGCLDTIQPHFQQARALLDEVEGHGLGTWPKRLARLSRAQNLLSPKVDQEVLDLVYQGILERRRLTVYYRRRGSDQAQPRILNPLGIVFVDSVIYLVGIVEGYEDTRQFALHRITEARLEEESAKEPAGFDLEKYIHSGAFSLPQSGSPLHLKLLVEQGVAIHLGECRISEDQSIRSTEDGYQVAATVQDTAQLRWWLLSFGDQVEVLEPRNFRQEFADLTRSMNQMYLS